MSRRSLPLFFLPGLLYILAGCSSDNSEETGPGVAVSVFPVYDIIRNVAGNEVRVEFFVPPGANPHTFEPVPSQVRQISRADVFIGVHPEFDGWIEDFLKPDATVFYLLEEGHDGDAGGTGHAHDVNPHIWLSVGGAREIAASAGRILGGSFPEGAAQFSRNQQRYAVRLDSMDAVLRQLLSGAEGAAIIEHHPAWEMFAADYGLKIAGTIEQGHGHTPSVKEFSNLISRGREARVSVIVMGLDVQSSTAASLAGEIGALLLRLDALGDPEQENRSTWLKLMEYNGRLLAEALTKPQ